MSFLSALLSDGTPRAKTRSFGRPSRSHLIVFWPSTPHPPCTSCVRRILQSGAALTPLAAPSALRSAELLISSPGISWPIYLLVAAKNQVIFGGRAGGL